MLLQYDRIFRKLTLITAVAVYFLILVGGIVRASGSGMGCPDWPKCFDQWVPPTESNQLPENYKEIYSQKRAKKNLNVLKMLKSLGLTSWANKIENDPAILQEESFNAVKTWTEYVNRLVGVIIGFLIILLCFFSFHLYKKDLILTIGSVITLILVSFQGWLGSIVVSTRLMPGMVTIHMVMAIVIVALLIYLYFRANLLVKKSRQVINTGHNAHIRFFMIIVIVMTAVQIILGTNVREGIDAVATFFNNSYRDQWVDKLGLNFYIHRSFSIVLLVTNAVFAYIILKSFNDKIIRFIAISLIFVLILEILAGIIMAYGAIPPFLQPVHLVLATMIFGMQFYLWLNYRAYGDSKLLHKST